MTDVAGDKQPPPILIGIVTDGRSEMNLQCCISVLHTQIEMMTNVQFSAHLVFARDINDILNVLYADKKLVGAFIIRHDANVPGKFATKAFASKEPFVVCPTPMPVVDWERVKNHALDAEEDVRFSGNVYNVKLQGMPRPSDSYARVASIDRFYGMFVRREVVDSIVTKHPEIVSQEKIAFALDGVYDGAFLKAEDRFVRLFGDKIWADIENQGGANGPLEYVGCVGHRKVLR